jgi:hypothetical protein
MMVVNTNGKFRDGKERIPNSITIIINTNIRSKIGQKDYERFSRYSVENKILRSLHVLLKLRVHILRLS